MPALGVTIAVIEDDDAMRKSIERMLHAQGYGSESFASAEAFIGSGAIECVKALILDIQLPGMSGIELLRRMRMSGSTLSVIFITAHDGNAMRAEALGLGCVGYLRKPFEAHELAEALERGVMR
jgi:FixJ family two-component response regulator